jgi:hypothetical protein
MQVFKIVFAVLMISFSILLFLVIFLKNFMLSTRFLPLPLFVTVCVRHVFLILIMKDYRSHKNINVMEALSRHFYSTIVAVHVRYQ